MPPEVNLARMKPVEQAPLPVGQASSLTVRAASLPPVPSRRLRRNEHLNTGLGSPVNRQAGMPDPPTRAAHARESGVPAVGQASSLTVRAASLPPVPSRRLRRNENLNTGLGSPVNRQAGMPDPPKRAAHARESDVPAVGQASSLTVRAASLPPVPSRRLRRNEHLNTGLGSPVNRQAGMPDPRRLPANFNPISTTPIDFP